MDITSVLTAVCLVVISAASVTRLMKSPSLEIAASRKALHQAQRRVHGKHFEVTTQIDVARNAWASMLRDPSLAKPVSVMLEVKVLDQIRSRADAIMGDLRSAQSSSQNDTPEEMRKCHSATWKQIQILNICMSDVRDSVERLSSLTANLRSCSESQSQAA